MSIVMREFLDFCFLGVTNSETESRLFLAASSFWHSLLEVNLFLFHSTHNDDFGTSEAENWIDLFSLENEKE